MAFRIPKTRNHGVTIPPDVRSELIAERKRQGVGREELARRIGCHPVHLLTMERGGKTHKMDMVELWARALGRRLEVRLAE